MFPSSSPREHGKPPRHPTTARGAASSPPLPFAPAGGGGGGAWSPAAAAGRPPSPASGRRPRCSAAGGGGGSGSGISMRSRALGRHTALLAVGLLLMLSGACSLMLPPDRQLPRTGSGSGGGGGFGRANQGFPFSGDDDDGGPISVASLGAASEDDYDLRFVEAVGGGARAAGTAAAADAAMAAAAGADNDNDADDDAAAAAAAQRAEAAALRGSGLGAVMTADEIRRSADVTAAAFMAGSAHGSGGSSGSGSSSSSGNSADIGVSLDGEPNAEALTLTPPPRGAPHVPAPDNGNGGGAAVSVVVMNWAKPDSVRAILDAYAPLASLVSEVIVLHLRRDTTFAYRHPRVRHVVDHTADARHGLSSRFLACLAARREAVLIQDDDVVLSPAAISALVSARRKAEAAAAAAAANGDSGGGSDATRPPPPPRAPLVGFWGRDWPEGAPPSYVMADVAPGRHPVALTVALLAGRADCAAFFAKAPLVEGFVRRHAQPYWNGEDVYFSLVSWQATGQKPLIIEPPLRGYRLLHSQYAPSAAAPGAAPTAVGGEMHLADPARHLAYRDAFLKVGMAALKLPPATTAAASGDEAAAVTAVS